LIKCVRSKKRINVFSSLRGDGNTVQHQTRGKPGTFHIRKGARGGGRGEGKTPLDNKGGNHENNKTK